MPVILTKKEAVSWTGDNACYPKKGPGYGSEIMSVILKRGPGHGRKTTPVVLKKGPDRGCEIVPVILKRAVSGT
jgi:hypothetical protein